MTCPVCGGKTHITNSRPSCDSVYRRRECRECKHRFNTYELEEDLIVKGVKKDVKNRKN